MEEMERTLATLVLHCRYQSTQCARRNRFYQAGMFDRKAAGYFSRLMRLQERCPGLEEVNVGSVIGTPQSVITEQLQRFAEDVMPHFKSATTAEAGTASHAGAPA